MIRFEQRISYEGTEGREPIDEIRKGLALRALDLGVAKVGERT